MKHNIISHLWWDSHRTRLFLDPILLQRLMNHLQLHLTITRGNSKQWDRGREVAQECIRHIQDSQVEKELLCSTIIIIQPLICKPIKKTLSWGRELITLKREWSSQRTICQLGDLPVDIVAVKTWGMLWRKSLRRYRISI
jgi:hypothetical protein